MNAYDLSFFPNSELKFNSAGVLYLQGDTGISAGIEASLKSVIGTTGAMPIFISVSGPGNNATYTIVKFVGVRIMAVNLRGGPTRRYLRVQPASFYIVHNPRKYSGKRRYPPESAAADRVSRKPDAPGYREWTFGGVSGICKFNPSSKARIFPDPDFDDGLNAYCLMERIK